MFSLTLLFTWVFFLIIAFLHQMKSTTVLSKTAMKGMSQNYDLLCTVMNCTKFLQIVY